MLSGANMDNHRDFDQSGDSGAYDAGHDAGAPHDVSLSHDDHDSVDDEAVMDRSHEFGTDERRMHVRAYNHWVMLLGDKTFPAIEDLDLESMDDFVDNSVLLDFTSGIENPAISHIGSAVARESGIAEDIDYVDDIPGRSLISRITDHYMEIIANQAPIGFEAEFVNQRDETVLYRGILLPFSSDDDSIDFVYGVINWKTLANQASTDELLLEIEDALTANPDVGFDTPLWQKDNAQSASDQDASFDLPDIAFGANVDADALNSQFAAKDGEADKPPAVAAGHLDIGHAVRRNTIAFSVSASADLLQGDKLDFGMTVPQQDAALQSEPEDAAADAAPAAPQAEADLHDWLAHAQDIAHKAKLSEDRSRSALYDAIGRAYDVSLVAARQPEALNEALHDAGIKVQERAPMTPIVKLVFGSDYDKTRLTEYAAALSHAHRQQLGFGKLPEFLENFAGGLKGVVREERRLRRPDVHAVEPSDPLADAYKALRAAPGVELDTVDCGDSEFAVLLARRDDDGKMVIVAALADDKVTDHVVGKIAN